MLRLIPFVLFGALVACGGSSSGSGVDSNKKLVELDATQRQQLCEYMVDAEGGAAASKMCGNGITVTVKSAADCATGLSGLSASCSATVDNAEACAEAAGDDLCNLISSSACSFLLQCQ